MNVSVLCVCVSFAVFSLLAGRAQAKAKSDDDCEVCIKFLTRLSDSIPEEDASNMDKIEKHLRKACKTAKGKENRFCYYIGATEDAATGIVNEVTKPMSWRKPVNKVCHALKSKDAQICDLKYEKSIDWKTVDLKKLRVKELKKILNDWGEECKGCAEKSDFIKLIETLKPKYVPHSEL
ncbi:mesencephalic astrocyte-derived neurotrophic factor homolog [Branchiostoma floridae]|uniref:Mesencephalic astrocyte-derived neurotrophic factor homolog n=1 Tax=Branchiostoma floridae TaxID=7739 RepID=C3ZQA0_BRAFL|nr:mesencephalic astrocyte-derived neurotrophic factor homolog [Branchiostoma floridae]|eukprot:XP_002589282.1 hypothetical protein BRAFLDRAFT_270549 [Branchiostoma floridae]